MNNFYVYEWYIKETNEVFYVGKGQGKRMFNTKRNRFFNNIYNKYECEVRIYKGDLTEDEAWNIEIERISQLKNIGQARTNIQPGGEGGGKGHDPRFGKNEKEIKEWNNNLKNAARNRWNNISEDELQDFKEVMRETVKGENNPFYGKTHSEENRKKFSNLLKGKKGDQCMNSKAVLLVDKNNSIVKRFETKHEAIRGNWRKDFPKPHGSGTVYKCFHENLDFHGLKFIYEKDYVEV